MDVIPVHKHFKDGDMIVLAVEDLTTYQHFLIFIFCQFILLVSFYFAGHRFPVYFDWY